MRYTIWSCSVFKAQEINTKLHITYEDENDCIFSFSYQFISFLLFAVHHFFLLYVYRVLHFGWQNEWVGNLLITYVSCILRVCVVCVFFSVIFSLFCMHFFILLLCAFTIGANAHAESNMLLLLREMCQWFAGSEGLVHNTFIADLLVESYHHYHLSRVHLLSYSPSSTSYGDFGTKF